MVIQPSERVNMAIHPSERVNMVIHPSKGEWVFDRYSLAKNTIRLKNMNFRQTRTAESAFLFRPHPVTVSSLGFLNRSTPLSVLKRPLA